MREVEKLKKWEFCEKCTLKNLPLVHGYGPDTAKIVIVGEAPGDTEVAQGKPFVGKAGQLLDKVLEEAGVDRQECYITNAVLCRPIPHRAPKAAELKACRARLINEIKERLPKVVIALGNAAAYSLLGVRNISDIHGTVNWQAEIGAYVVPTYHPAAVLRTPSHYIDLIQDIKRAAALLDKTPHVTVAPSVEYITLHTYDDVLALANRLETISHVALDVETASTGKLLSLALSWKTGTAVVVTESALADPRVIPLLDRALSDKVIIGHNLKYDVKVLWRNGFASIRVGEDTMLMHYTIDERPGEHKLKPLVRRYLNVPDYDAPIKEYYTHMEDCPPNELWRYNAYDAAYTYMLWKLLGEEVDSDGKWLLHNMLYPAANVLARMEYTGVMVDKAYLSNLRTKLEKEAQELEQEMFKIAGREFNPRSPKQLVQLLYYDLGLPIPNGRLSTDEEALLAIQEFHPLPSKLLEYRGKLKTLRTYVIPLLENADENGRIHTNFNLHGTVCVTGDTIVLTNRGWYRIRDLFPSQLTEGFTEAPSGLMVYDGISWQPVTHLFYGGRRTTLRIKLALGVTLQCTKEHPLLTRRGWVAAEELHPGDYVLSAIGVTPDGDSTVSLQPELARLIGYYVADGTLDLPASNGAYRLRIANDDPVIKADVAYCIEKVMGRTPYIGETSVEISDKEKVLWFARLVDYKPPKEKGERALHKTCPTVIRQGDRQTIIEYLRGLANDSSFSMVNKKPYCVFRTVNRDVAQWTHQFLLALGYKASFIETPFQKAKYGHIYSVRLRGNEALRFLQEVRPVRLNPEELKHAPSLRNWCRKHTDVDAQGRIWLKVLSVQESTVEEVFDLTVQSTHAFTTNCIVSHNTGRLSSSDPINLQNIPRTEEARNSFIATPGYTLVEGDLSQAEVRVLAWYSKDPALIETLRSGVDMHIRTACLMFHKKPEEVTPELRQAAKDLTFGVIYGMTPQGLAKELGCSVREAQELQEQFFAAYPRVREWIREQQQRVLATGIVETPFKRKRRFEYITPENKAEVMRQAVNTPIQSLASDITLSALIRIGHKLGNDSNTRLLLTVHDSILLETREDPVEVARWLKQEMVGSVLDGTVPFDAEVKIGERWGSLEEVSHA